MNKNLIVILSVAMIFILACAIGGTTPQNEQPPVSQPTYTPLPTYTPFPSQVVEATATTEAPPPSATSPITQPSGPAFTASQWSGTLVSSWYSFKVAMIMIVEKVSDTTFTGKMSWRIGNKAECTALMAINGEIFTDISTASEQNRWAFHPDFISGDKSGTWLRWTQIENRGSDRCGTPPVGDWWYAHIRSDGHLIGIWFFNDTDPSPDKESFLDLTLD